MPMPFLFKKLGQKRVFEHYLVRCHMFSNGQQWAETVLGRQTFQHLR